eukprot:jgi/Hompol1/1042/HPOL_004499-RA
MIAHLAAIEQPTIAPEARKTNDRCLSELSRVLKRGATPHSFECRRKNSYKVRRGMLWQDFVEEISKILEMALNFDEDSKTVLAARAVLSESLTQLWTFEFEDVQVCSDENTPSRVPLQDSMVTDSDEQPEDEDEDEEQSRKRPRKQFSTLEMPQSVGKDQSQSAVPRPTTAASKPSKPTGAFADPVLVERFVKQIAPQLTLNDLVFEIIVAAIMGNRSIGLPKVTAAPWPNSLGRSIIRLLAGYAQINSALPSLGSGQSNDKEACRSAQLELSLGLAELIFDEAELEHRSHSKQRSASDELAENVLVDHSPFGILSRLVGEIRSNSLHQSSKTEIEIRVQWMFSQYANMLGRPDTEDYALACLALICVDEENGDNSSKRNQPAMTTVTLPNSSFNAISPDKIQAFLDELAARKLFERVQQLFNAKMYSQVIDQLSPVLLSTTAGETVSATPAINSAKSLLSQARMSRKRLELLDMLMQMLETTTRLAKLVKHDVESVVKQAQGDIYPLAIFLARLVWEIMTAVSDGEYGLGQRKPASEGRKMASRFIVWGWILFVSVAQYELGSENMKTGVLEQRVTNDDDCNSSSVSEASPQKRLVSIMGWVHEQLGEIFLCGSDNAAFLRYMMEYLSSMDYEFTYTHVNQCFACMYGFVIKLDREVLYEHECEQLPFEKTAATQVFELVSPYILEAVLSCNYRSVTFDIRDCFEKIYKVLGDITAQNCSHLAIANELLNWSALKIVQSRPNIAGHQRRAFNCFVRAIKLLRSPGIMKNRPQAVSAEMTQLLWKSMSSVAYSIASKPMEGIALNADIYTIKELWLARSLDSQKRNDQFTRAIESSVAPVQRAHVFAVALYCQRASRQNATDGWEAHFFTAKILRKLGRINEAIAELELSVTLATRETATKDTDKILEPIIAMVDTLVVALHRGQISTEKAQDVLLRLPSMLPLVDRRQFDDLISVGLASHIRALTDESGVFQHLSAIISVIKTMDKKKWHHKPIYRNAWILANVYCNPAAAKSELLTLFQFKSSQQKTLKSHKGRVSAKTTVPPYIQIR